MKINYKLNIFFILLYLVTGVSFAQNKSSLSLSSSVWRDEFKHLVDAGNINGSKAAAKIGLANFTKESFWSSNEFQSLWLKYLEMSSLSNWSSRDYGQSLYLPSIEHEKYKNRSLLGIISNGQSDKTIYWLSITKPENGEDWICSKTGCDIYLNVSGYKDKILLRAVPTTDSDGSETESVGIKLSSVPDLPLYISRWSFEIPTKTGEVANYSFDMSFSGKLIIKK